MKLGPYNFLRYSRSSALRSKIDLVYLPNRTIIFKECNTIKTMVEGLKALGKQFSSDLRLCPSYQTKVVTTALYISSTVTLYKHLDHTV